MRRSQGVPSRRPQPCPKCAARDPAAIPQQTRSPPAHARRARAQPLPTWDEAHLGNRRIGARSSRWRVDRSHPRPAGASGLRDRRCVHDPAGFCRRSRKDCGVPLAFSDTEKLAQHPDGDLVTVSVKVPDHYLPVMAAIEAGQHVYCEWPLGRDTTKPLEMLAASRAQGIGHAIGSKADVSGDQLRQGPDCRGLCRPGFVGDNDWLCPELGSHDRPAVTRPISLTEPTCSRSPGPYD